MKVLIACEYSGIVREAFTSFGHDAWSCDILPTEIPGNHLQCDVLTVLNNGWDLMIAHPPCTALCSAGQWFYKSKPDLVKESVEFFMKLVNAPVKRICIENPAGIMTRLYRKPNQTVDPYFFGEPHLKRTCLWLKNLPRINGLIEVARNKKNSKPQCIATDVSGKKRYFTDMKSGKDKQKERSKSFVSIANAMASQWTNL